MKEGTDRSPREGKRNKYVSAIRINGVPILPPLITPEKRKELRRYKREAIKVEKRLQREKELKIYITHMCQTCTTELNDDLNSTVVDLIENASNFQDSFDQLECNSRESVEVELLNHLPLSIYTQVIEYINEDERNSPKVELSKSVEDHFKEADGSKTPKLIRSNSYILDAPSPALMEYLKTKQESNCWEPKLSPKESTCSEFKDECDIQSECVIDQTIQANNGFHDVDVLNMKDKGIITINHIENNNVLEDTYIDNKIDQTIIIRNNIDERKHMMDNDLQVISIDGDDTPRSLEQLKQPSCLLDTKLSTLNLSDEFCDSSRTETELRNLSDCESNLQEFVVNNMPVKNEEIHVNKSNSNTNSSRSELNGILRNIPAQYSRQILEILERQQLSTEDFNDIHNEPEKYSTPHDTTILGETIYYSVDDYDDEIINNDDKEHVISPGELDKDSSLSLPIHDYGNVSLQDIEKHDEQSMQQDKQPMNMNRAKEKKLGRSHAASIINAAAKGFLIRRLMKTEKVQNLIQTIKDAVLFAVQLHQDTLEHIEAADVELHRRLIQQVSAACYSFHDVFFSTSIRDQMSFIAVDRQKKLEKLRRTSSATSTSSNRSSKSAASTRRSRNFALRS